MPPQLATPRQRVGHPTPHHTHASCHSTPAPVVQLADFTSVFGLPCACGCWLCCLSVVCVGVVVPQHVIRAPVDGVVASVNCEMDGFVEDGTVLVTFADEEE